jgi:hypothetical protein
MFKQEEWHEWICSGHKGEKNTLKICWKNKKGKQNMEGLAVE